jgi:fumarate hydratase class II
MEANEAACADTVERSLAMVTALNPHIGYEKAASIAKEAFATGATIRGLCRAQNVLADEVLDEVLDPYRMTEPRA